MRTCLTRGLLRLKSAPKSHTGEQKARAKAKVGCVESKRCSYIEEWRVGKS